MLIVLWLSSTSSALVLPGGSMREYSLIVRRYGEADKNAAQSSSAAPAESKGSMSFRLVAPESTQQMPR